MLRSTTRTAALLAIALLLCTSAWAVQGAGAQASKRPTAGSHITAKMVFDCAHMTKEALNYAVQHNYCSAPTASPTGIVQPNTSYPAQGDCGRTEVQIYNTGQSGRAGFYEDVLSYAGPIARLSYTVNWTNWSSGGGGVLGGGAWPFGSSWDHDDSVGTGSGYLTAVMSGTAWTTWGGPCVFGNPTADGQIQ